MPYEPEEWLPDAPVWTPPKTTPPPVQQQPQPGMLDSILGALSWHPDIWGPAAAQYAEPALKYGEQGNDFTHRAVGAAGAFTSNFGKLVDSVILNPTNLALAGLSGGSSALAGVAGASENFAAKQALMRAAQAMQFPGRVASGAMLGHGLYRATDENAPWDEKASGVIEGILGGMGLRAPGIEVPKMDVLSAEPPSTAMVPRTNPIEGAGPEVAPVPQEPIIPKFIDQPTFFDKATIRNWTGLPETQVDKTPVWDPKEFVGGGIAPQEPEFMGVSPVQKTISQLIRGIPQTGNMELDNAVSKLQALRSKGGLTDSEMNDFENTAEYIRNHPDFPPEINQEWTDIGNANAARGPKFQPGDRVQIREQQPLTSGPQRIEEPSQMARTESGGTKMDIGNPKEMMQIFRNTYSGSIPHVATKELLQNAIDATAELGPAGKVNVFIDPKLHTIAVGDNGPGLTRDEIDTVYTNLSSSGKRGGTQKTVGELGVGKTTYMIAGDRVDVKSVARDPKDGKLYETSFGGTPDELMDEFHPTQVEVPEGTPTGTKVSMVAPADSQYGDLSRYIKHFQKYSNNPVNIHVDQKAQQSWENDQSFDIPPRSVQPGRDVGGENLPETKFNVSIPTDATWIEGNQIPLIINNRGMFQGVDSHHIGKAAQIPDRLVVDLDPNVPGTHKDYPLTAPTRERLKYETSYKIGQFINKNLVEAAQKKRGDELTRIYDQIARSPGHVYYDGGKRYTPDEIERVRTSVPLKKIANVTRDVTNQLSLLIPSGTRIVKTGFVMDKVRGVNLRHPDNNTHETIALINPFEQFKHNGPKEAAQGIVHTTIHEWVHRDVRAEGAEFTSKLADAYEKFSLEEQIRARNKIFKQLTNDGINYTPEIQKLLQDYTLSRGREATSNDILLREAGSGFLGAKNKGQLPPNPEPDGEGTPPVNQRAPIDDVKKFTPELQASVEKLKAGIKLGLDARRMQDKLYSIERAKRAQIASSVKTPGLKGYYEQLGMLRGELPKIPSGSQLQQNDVDNLIDAITNSDLDFYKSINAKSGLLKVMTGRAPQLSELVHLNKVFGKDFGELIMLHGGLGAVPIKDLVNSVVNVPKSIMASIDLSAPLRQGLPLIYRGEWWNSFKSMFDYAGSEKAFQDAQETMMAHPLFPMWNDVGLFIASIDDTLARREEQFLSPIAERLPLGVGALIRGSERAYVGFLNKLRFDSANALLEEVKNMGHEIMTQEIDGKTGKVTQVPSKLVYDIANFLNVSTGRGSLGRFEKNAVELNAAIFSPRMISANLTMLNPKYYTDKNTHPFVRKEALKALLAVAAAGLLTTQLAKRMGGEVNSNPISSDFGKAKFGNTRIDPWRGFQQYVVAAARFVSGKTTSTNNQTRDLGSGVMPTRLGTVVGIGNKYSPSLLENKASPIASFIDDMLSGRTYPPGGVGQLITDKVTQHTYGDKPVGFAVPKRVSGEIINRYTPMFISDLVDVLRDNPRYIPLTLLGLFGYGVQTFGPKSNPRANQDQQQGVQP